MAVVSRHDVCIGSSRDRHDLAGLKGDRLPVILGGFAILSVAGMTAWKAPRLRRLDLRELQ